MLGDNLLIGGDLTLNIPKRNLIVGNNIGVSGNIWVTKELMNTEKVNKLDCFGGFNLIKN